MAAPPPVSSSTAGRRAFDPAERRIVAFTGVAHAATHAAELVYPTLAVALVAETGLPLERVLGWSFAGYLLFGLGALPAGVLADRFGARRLILLGLAVSGASLAAAACAPTGLPLVLCLAGVGLGASAYHPAGMGLLTRGVAARGRALAVNGIYGNVGIAATPLATALLAEALGWRGALLAWGAAMLLGSAVFARMRIEEPPPAPRGPDAVPAETDAPPARTVAAFVVLSLAAMLGGFAYRANTLAQPAFFAERIGALDYGVATTLAMGVGVVGQYAGGVVADHRDLRWGYLAFHALSWPFLLLVPYAAGLPLLAVSGAYVFFALGMQPLENSLYAHLTPERWRSTAYGLKFVVVFGVGSTAALAVRGISATAGLAGVYRVLGGVVAGMLVLIALLVALTARRRRAGAAGAAGLAPREASVHTPAR